MTARRSPNSGRPWACFPTPTPGPLWRARPVELAISDATWSRLADLHGAGALPDEFATAFANGRAFLEAPDALRGRRPRLVEWTGGRRPPGDEVAPVDLRIDHVYLVSCKYLSRNIANPSPARLFDGLLATVGDWEQSDWYLRTAPDEYRALYAACREITGLDDLPDDPVALTTVDRQRLRQALPGRSYPVEAQRQYQHPSVSRVSVLSAERWRENVTRQRRRRTSGVEAPAHRQRHLLPAGRRRQAVVAAADRQPLGLAPGFRVPRSRHPARPTPASLRWTGRFSTVSGPRRRRTVEGHVEVRWSHGRFAQPPEAKIYLETRPTRFPDTSHSAPSRTDLACGPDRVRSVRRRRRRPSRARPRVSSSAYSRSPPTGSPLAIRVTTTLQRLQEPGQVHGRGLALEVGIGARIPRSPPPGRARAKSHGRAAGRVRRPRWD